MQNHCNPEGSKSLRWCLTANVGGIREVEERKIRGAPNPGATHGSKPYSRVNCLFRTHAAQTISNFLGAVASLIGQFVEGRAKALHWKRGAPPIQNDHFPGIKHKKCISLRGPQRINNAQQQWQRIAGNSQVAYRIDIGNHLTPDGLEP